ncbi:MAG: class I SAM-dependent methyltransferase [Nitrospirae bacterium]|nr:class I SAM-dependent methyltransferase [Nitrospirota bacterium]
MKIFKTQDFLAGFLINHHQEKILDLGCGNRKVSGAIGVDCIVSTIVDVVHDLNQFPYPFDDASFDAVVLNHVIEHLEDIPHTLKEVHRLLKPEGEVWIATPHFSDSHSWVDHTHRYHLSIRSFIIRHTQPL